MLITWRGERRSLERPAATDPRRHARNLTWPAGMSAGRHDAWFLDDASWSETWGRVVQTYSCSSLRDVEPCGNECASG